MTRQEAATGISDLSRKISPSFLTFARPGIGAVTYRSQFTIVITFTPIAFATSFCLNRFPSLAFLIHSPKVDDA